MDRGTALLQNLRGQLQNWLLTIQRATGATDVSFVPHTAGEFTIRVTWRPKGGEEQTYDRVFTRQEVFGASYQTSPQTWRVQRKACDYAREIMRQVLTIRGAV